MIEIVTFLIKEKSTINNLLRLTERKLYVKCLTSLAYDYHQISTFIIQE